jgi:hypothetical protein
VSAHSHALLSFIEARLEKCDLSISAGRFGNALPFESDRLPRSRYFRQFLSMIAWGSPIISVRGGA